MWTIHYKWVDPDYSLNLGELFLFPPDVHIIISEWYSLENDPCNSHFSPQLFALPGKG